MAPLVIAAQPHQTEANPSIVSQAITPTATRLTMPKITTRRRVDRSSRWLIDHHGQWYEDGQNDEGDQEVRPEGDPLDVVRHMPLQSEPDERLDDLMGAEKQRQRGQCDMAVTLLGIVNRSHAD